MINLNLFWTAFPNVVTAEIDWKRVICQAGKTHSPTPFQRMANPKKGSLKNVNSQRKIILCSQNWLPCRDWWGRVCVSAWLKNRMKEYPLLAALASHLLVIQSDIFDLSLILSRIYNDDPCFFYNTCQHNLIGVLGPWGLNSLNL